MAREAMLVAPLAQRMGPARGYYELTKPGITLFVAISAAAGYVVSTGGRVDPATLAFLLLSTIAMSGGGAALNQVAERDADARMRRTTRRPIPAGLVTARSASQFGWLLSAIGALIAGLTLPWLAGLFLVASHVSYVYIYTPMKRRTPLCTLAGAIPGSLPVLAGSAATGGVPDAAGVALAGVLYAWQLPHFLAIGWLMRDDYARAGFPMLGVIEASGRASALVSLVFALATLAGAVVVVREAAIGGVAIAVSIGTAIAYVLATLPFLRTRAQKEARRLFLASLLVLPLVLGALMIDLALRG